MTSLGEDVVWANAGPYLDGYSKQGSIWRTTGNSTSQLISEFASTWAVARSGLHVFYSTGSYFGAIRELEGSFAFTLADRTAKALTTDGTDIFGIDGEAVWRLPWAVNGPIVELAPAAACGVPEGRAIAADATHAYWFTECGDVSRISKSGGASELLGKLPNITHHGPNGRLALDDDWVYVADLEGLEAIPKQGGTIVQVAPDIGYAPGGVAVDQNAVYWHSGAALLRAARL